MAATVRLHIQNPVERLGALRLSRERLELALAGRGLGDRFIVSQQDGGETLSDAAADAEILFLLTKAPLDAARRKAKALRWVQTAYAGVENILDTRPDDLLVANASGVHSEKGAEFILTAALMLTYSIPQFIEDRAAASWSPVHGPTLRTKRVTLLGLGAIGSAAAVLLQRQGCAVSAVTRSGKAKVAVDAVTDMSGIDDLLVETDILISTLPETPETNNLIDRERIGMLPRGSGIVVVGRAAVLDYDAILDRLDDGSMGGAVLDVFPDEPIPKGDRIWSTPRLIVTPHCGIDDHTTYIDRCLDIFIDNLERDLAGKKLRNLVDPDKGY